MLQVLSEVVFSIEVDLATIGYHRKICGFLHPCVGWTVFPYP